MIEEPAAQRKRAAGVRAPWRSDCHRTPSKRLVDAVAAAAGRQHGALVVPKQTTDGQLPVWQAPVKADRSKAGTSQRGYIPPFPR